MIYEDKWYVAVYIFTTHCMIKMYYVIPPSPSCSWSVSEHSFTQPTSSASRLPAKKKSWGSSFVQKGGSTSQPARGHNYDTDENTNAIAVHHKSFVPLFPGKLFIDLPSAGRHDGNRLCGTHLSINRPIKWTCFPWTDIDEVDVIKTGSFSINFLI